MDQTKKQHKKELEVVESFQEDIDKGVARISSRVMDELGMVSGDIIDIKGKEITIAKVLRLPEKDNGQEIIRLDGTTRSNSNTSIGEKVTIHRLNVVDAKTVVLSPLQELIFPPLSSYII